MVRVSMRAQPRSDKDLSQVILVKTKVLCSPQISGGQVDCYIF
jgi:hypothetical protein